MVSAAWHVPGQVDSAPSKAQRRAGILQQAEEQNTCHLRDTQASLAQTAWDESGSLGGTFSVYQKDLCGACGKGDSILHLVLWKPRPAGRSNELNSWIHLVWFLGVNECCLKQFLELQPLPVTCKMSKGDLKTRWS